MPAVHRAYRFDLLRAVILQAVYVHVLALLFEHRVEHSKLTVSLIAKLGDGNRLEWARLSRGRSLVRHDVVVELFVGGHGVGL